MRLFVMTDMEGCAGIFNCDEWVLKTGRYYEDGRRILTGELNAATEGFFEGGATEVVVWDGHGAGGINPLMLDSRIQLIHRNCKPVYPSLLDKSFAGVAWVGQHAKAGTPYSHITHTQSFGYIDLQINGVSIGEYGQFALCAMELGVPSFFAAGEEALAREAEALTPGVVTVGVKRGLLADGLDHLPAEEYARAKLTAIHLAPAEACRRIRAGARAAAIQLREHPESFRYPDIKPPYRMVSRIRATKDRPPYESVTEHPSSLIALLNGEGTRRESSKASGHGVLKNSPGNKPIQAPDG